MGKAKIVQKTVQCELGDYEFAEVMPIADLHIGDATMNKKLLKSVCEWVNEKDYRYVVIAGDIFNAGLKTSVSDVYQESMNLQAAMEYFKEFVTMMGKDNILAVIRGNHDNRVVKAVGVDPVAVVCEINGLVYCGAEAFLSLNVGDWNVGRADKKRSPVKYLMYMTHGVGGGRLMGGKINGVMRHNNTIVADITVQGHTHAPAIVPSSIYVSDVTNQSIIEKDQLFIITCGFVGRDGYAKDFCFAPLSQKFPIIRIGGRQKKLEAELREF